MIRMSLPVVGTTNVSWLGVWRDEDSRWFSIGIRLGTVNPKVPADWVNNAFANPHQEVSPVLVRL